MTLEIPRVSLALKDVIAQVQPPDVAEMAALEAEQVALAEAADDVCGGDDGPGHEEVPQLENFADGDDIEWENLAALNLGGFAHLLTKESLSKYEMKVDKPPGIFVLVQSASALPVLLLHSRFENEHLMGFTVSA